MDDKVEMLLNGNQFRKFQESYFSGLSKEYELNLADIRVLLFLHEHKCYDTARDIVERHYLAKSYVSKSVEKLIEHGFLERQYLQEDRRYVHLLVREEALPVIEAVREQKQKMLERLFRGVSPEELAVLQKVASQISGNIIAEIRQQR